MPVKTDSPFSALPRLRQKANAPLPARAPRLPVILSLWGVALTGAFVLGAGLNMMIFKFWGLDFLLIASRADVVQAGLSLLFRILPTLLIGAIAAQTVYLSAGDGRKRFVLIAAFSLLATMVNIAVPQIEWLSTGALIASGFAFFALLLKFAGKGQTRPMRVNDPQFYNAAAVWLAFIALHTVAGAVSAGYFDHRVRMVAKAPAAPLPGESYCENWLVWRGERTMLVDCEVHAPMSKLKLINSPNDFEAMIDRPLRRRGWAGSGIEAERRRFEKAQQALAQTAAGPTITPVPQAAIAPAKAP